MRTERTTDNASRPAAEAVEIDWLGRLRPRRSTVLELAAELSLVGPEGAAGLWADLERFASGFARLAANRRELAALAAAQVGALNPRAVLRMAPRGRVLFVVPSNATLPLAFVVPCALLAAGNEVVVAASGGVRPLAEELLAPLVAEFGEPWIRLLTGGVRESIAAEVDTGSVDALYYTGASAHYADLAGRCAAAGVELIYEGSGNSAAVVDDRLDPADLPIVAAQLARSLTFANGRMCTSPNVISVHHSLYDRVREELIGAYEKYPPSIAAERLLGAELAVAGPGPVWLPDCPDIATGQHRELFGPASYLTSHQSWDQLLADLRRATYRLQIAFYSRSDERWSQLQQETRFARYCRNLPGSDQDPLLPWGNHGLSGSSQVEDFVAKGLRPVLVEEGEL